MLWSASGIQLVSWQVYALGFVMSTVGLGLASLFVEDFKVTNPLSLIVAAAVLSAAETLANMATSVIPLPSI